VPLASGTRRSPSLCFVFCFSEIFRRFLPSPPHSRLSPTPFHISRTCLGLPPSWPPFQDPRSEILPLFCYLLSSCLFSFKVELYFFPPSDFSGLESTRVPLVSLYDGLLHRCTCSLVSLFPSSSTYFSSRAPRRSSFFSPFLGTRESFKPSESPFLFLMRNPTLPVRSPDFDRRFLFRFY